MNNKHVNPEYEAAQNAQLGQLLQSHLPVASPSDALQQRIASLAKQAPQQQKTQPQTTRLPRARRWRMAFSVAALALTITAGSIVWPRVLAKQALARVEEAMEHVSSAHITRYRIEDGKRIKKSEAWFENGKWRGEWFDTHITWVYANGTKWSFNQKSNAVTVTKSPKGPFGQEPSGFTFTELTHSSFGNPTSKTTVTLQGTTTLNGRSLKRALIETDDNYEDSQTLLLVDEETDLPVSADMHARNRYGKEEHWQIDFEYNQPLTPDLFKPNFGPSAKFVTAQPANPSLDNDKRLVQGLARKRVGERTIAIRSLEVNKNGSVFLFYTAGKSLKDAFTDGKNFRFGQDWKVFLSDSLGTRYQWMRSGELRTGNVNPHTVQGERLEGDWWIPLNSPAPGQKWQPRTFTLEFQVNPKNLHGPIGTKFSPDYSEEEKFSIAVSSAESTVVPPVVKKLNIQLPEQEVVAQEQETRGELPPGVQPSPELVREVSKDGVFSPDSTQLAIGEMGGVRLVRLADGKTTRKLDVPTSTTSPQNIVFSPDGRFLFARFAFVEGSQTGWNAQVWDVKTGRALASWRWNSAPDVTLRSLQFTPDGETLRAVNVVVTKRGGDETRQWVEQSNVQTEERDALTGRVLSQKVLPHGGFVLSAQQSAPSNTGSWTIVTGQNSSPQRPGGIIRVWDGQSGQLRSTLPVASDYYASRVAVGGEGTSALIGVNCEPMRNGQVVMSGGNQIQLYSQATGEYLSAVIPQLEGYIASSAISPDGKLVASENTDHTVGVWNTETGRLERSLVGHSTNIASLQFSPDGHSLLTSDLNDKRLLWRLP